ncbi:MAG: hypothetical protein L0H96_06890 [Humibacillus sp.]|nr:hypothetical protein [Humibacillus sp.]MDN5776619.1 hypothetical protein [Humibacillus sp.]
MADSRSRGPLVYLADVSMEVDGPHGVTRAHLGNDESGLVLDVASPATLFRSLPTRSLTRDLPVGFPRDVFAGTNVRLTSQGHDLGRARLDEKGRVRFAPTPIGVVVLGRAASTVMDRSQRRWLAASLLAIVAAILAWARQRRS